MSTLQESITTRRAELLAEWPCVLIGPQVPALLVCVWQVGNWMLPWSCLLAGRHVDTDNGEDLELSFTGHVVMASGHNLRGLLDDLAAFRVSCLRNLPLQYRAKFPDGAPFLIRLQVHESISGPRSILQTPG